jgi:hypothetical protein
MKYVTRRLCAQCTAAWRNQGTQLWPVEQANQRARVLGLGSEHKAVAAEGGEDGGGCGGGEGVEVAV